MDNSIKIWKINNNNNYESIITLVHFDKINSILFLEDKKLLISSGNDGTKLWDLNKDNYNDINCIKHFENTFCGWHNALNRIDNYECIQEIKEAHNLYIYGFIELKDGSIASFSNDETIKIWSF